MVCKFSTPANFNPRSPHGERLGIVNRSVDDSQFQSTLPAWGATFNKPIIIPCSTFQSTLPAWGATGYMAAQQAKNLISIHAPRMGSDEVK